ncbi:MAG: tetratricopeptide repeat protein [Chloroflexi bacterium]|nr:tetratricopeptide repeat protein [Chloroflexota bacterium]
MRKAHNLAWDRKWLPAIAEYRRALAEVDDDPLVWISLGSALAEARRLADAKAAYQRAGELAPDDATVLQKLADIYTRLRDVENASQMYLMMATAYMKNREPLKAIQAWRAIVRLSPAHIESRRRLAELLEQVGLNTESAEEHVTVARLLRERGQDAEATTHARKALTLDPQNRQALTINQSLQAPAGAPRGLRSLMLPRQSVPSPKLGDNPAQEAAQRALSRLAEVVSERKKAAQGPVGTAPLSAESLIAQALEFQSGNRLGEAIGCYQRAVALGANWPEVHFNLGMVCLKASRFDEAINELSQSLDAPDYMLGACYALAQIHQSRGRLADALEALLAAMHTVELRSVAPAQADTVTTLYQELAARFTTADQEGPARHLLSALFSLMNDKNWAERVGQLRRGLDTQFGYAALATVAELVGYPNPEEALMALVLSHDLLERQKTPSALEEVYRAIALAPAYLPLHAHLAEVFARQGHIQAAVEKYQVIAALQRVRRESLALADTYRQILKLVPQDTDTRARHIERLLQSNAIDEAIDQYVALGDAHYHLAQLDRAVSAYEEALRLIPRAAQDRWSVTIYHLLGEVYIQRVDWKGAAEVYRRIRELAPNDDKASLRLIDLAFKQGDDDAALRELDSLSARYEQTGEMAALLGVVTDLAALRPKNAALKERMADLLVKQGQGERAVSELDFLGELQLRAGQTQAAALTIERIIALSPPNVENYRELLQQLRAAH